MNYNTSLRDAAALSALTGLTVNENYCLEKIVKIAYEYADAFIAARELDDKIEIYKQKFQKEIDNRKTRVENSEKLQKALKPFYEYAKNNNLSHSCILNFISNYEYSEGDDAIAVFKAWEAGRKKAHGSLLEEFSKTLQQEKENEA